MFLSSCLFVWLFLFYFSTAANSKAIIQVEMALKAAEQKEIKKQAEKAAKAKMGALRVCVYVLFCDQA